MLLDYIEIVIHMVYVHYVSLYVSDNDAEHFTVYYTKKKYLQCQKII